MKLRSDQELRTSLAEVLDEATYSPDSALYRGCIAALEWVTAQRQAGPVSLDVTMAANPSSIADELVAAIAMLHGERAITPRLSRAYLSGVEMTLSWVLGHTDEPPL